jgi:hypothetical protein
MRPPGGAKFIADERLEEVEGGAVSDEGDARPRGLAERFPS